jgi:hypothetical protein
MSKVVGMLKQRHRALVNDAMDIFSRVEVLTGPKLAAAAMACGRQGADRQDNSCARNSSSRGYGHWRLCPAQVLLWLRQAHVTVVAPSPRSLNFRAPADCRRTEPCCNRPQASTTVPAIDQAHRRRHSAQTNGAGSTVLPALWPLESPSWSISRKANAFSSNTARDLGRNATYSTGHVLPETPRPLKHQLALTLARPARTCSTQLGKPSYHIVKTIPGLSAWRRRQQYPQLSCSVAESNVLQQSSSSRFPAAAKCQS